MSDMISGLKIWYKERPEWDVGSVTAWFLLSFIYLQGVPNDPRDFDFYWSGILPSMQVPYPTVGIALVCLLISAIILVEPILPSTVRQYIKGTRSSSGWQFIFWFNVLVAFIFGFLAGRAHLEESLPYFWWLVDSITYLGMAIMLVLFVKVTLTVIGAVRSTRSA